MRPIHPQLTHFGQYQLYARFQSESEFAWLSPSVESEELCMVTKPSRRAAEAPESTNLAALTKLASASYEILERELRATIAALESQALRFETAIDNVSQGICFFGVDERLILCNRRYAEIYRIAPDELQPGLTLGEIVERRVAAGTSAMPTDAYLTMARSVNSSNASRIWSAKLADGRTIQICHQPMPDGSWV
ncbi:PAS-domain containing protein, partial [Mesorhizobium sp. IMUNJ 23033]|uniref:PAS-domain containing protein n=1 Tax=Mesorhizobium sp. IMUNJ 23033 TaxID=3378039 RepID=UPI00384D0428